MFWAQRHEWLRSVSGSTCNGVQRPICVVCGRGRTRALRLFFHCRYADPDNQLSIVVLKNVYDAQTVYDGPGDDTAELFACVRRELLRAHD